MTFFFGEGTNSVTLVVGVSEINCANAWSNSVDCAGINSIRGGDVGLNKLWNGWSPPAITGLGSKEQVLCSKKGEKVAKGEMGERNMSWVNCCCCCIVIVAESSRVVVGIKEGLRRAGRLLCFF